ncbi:MAG: hypothetical protein FJ317_05990 [SAR202 cluster bacterium]|nr:hypothetical protein [SAR202 cluster bacterium]
MTTQKPPKPMDKAWGALSDLPKAERETQMKQRYTELAKLPEDQRISKQVEMARAEHSLPSDKLREFTLSRYRSWLLMNEEAAKQTALDYNTAMYQLPSTAAMHRVALAQTLGHEFSEEDRERLNTINPIGFGTFLIQAQDRGKVLGKPTEKVVETKKSRLPFGKKD